MYSKLTNEKGDISLPPNYGGSVFGRRESPPRFIPPQGMAARRPAREYAPPAVVSEIRAKTDETNCDTSKGDTIEESYNDRPYSDAYAPQQCDQDESTHRETKKDADECEKKHPLFPSLSSIGTEELLLIAIALMIFQGGKEPDLALILLALLFIN